jgi:hypothetical protein
VGEAAGTVKAGTAHGRTALPEPAAVPVTEETTGRDG